ncbi:alpha/beta fold hydrolase [Aspergillus ibericus CBS 121593]|uniref:Alpha/beta hydrolase protein n=1 Tax=Aspergillus ibericus CBS 121593 TaxID=1448316 RepID=A0A395GQI4_9EURO|nr:alpha/beta hydrolase protein [Aspergillus ibericus CBS 121593]RAK96323.1 alpha/beta hydrolase protein [Aspergillus ibericus CBS 121593]
MATESPILSTLSLTVNSHPLRLSTLYRPGPKPAILFLHGFGSCKEDLHDLIYLPSLRDHTVIAYDAPGCGASEHYGPSSDLTIPFLVATAQAVLAHYHITSFYLIGHSTGALTALMLATMLPRTQQLLAFINIEGTLSHDNCFFSRTLYNDLLKSTSPEDDLEKLIAYVNSTPGYSHSLYASLLRSRVRPDAVKPIVTSTVQLSWKNLLGRFVRLSCPLMYMYGDQNCEATFLDQLEKNGVELARIPMSGHFPMYSNSAKMFKRIEGFFRDCSFATSSNSSASGGSF